MTVPTDFLHRRKKVPEISASARKAAKEQSTLAATQAQNQTEAMKKQANFANQKTQKETTKKSGVREVREKISCDFIEIQTDLKNVAGVEFAELFPDNLPEKAIELKNYNQGMKDKEKDDDKTAEQIKNAMK